MSIAQVPVDLVTASASGLDPDISLQGALVQVNRVARARGLQPQRVEQLVRSHVHDRTLGFLGSRRVNVLELNLALSQSCVRNEPARAQRRRDPAPPPRAGRGGGLARRAGGRGLAVPAARRDRGPRAAPRPTRHRLDRTRAAVAAARRLERRPRALARARADQRADFNFLFTQPYNSFRIESSASIAAFVIYVLIALVLANYVSGFRDRERRGHAASAQHGAAADPRGRPDPQRRSAPAAAPRALRSQRRRSGCAARRSA